MLTSFITRVEKDEVLSIINVCNTYMNIRMTLDYMHVITYTICNTYMK